MSNMEHEMSTWNLEKSTSDSTLYFIWTIRRQKEIAAPHGMCRAGRAMGGSHIINRIVNTQPDFICINIT